MHYIGVIIVTLSRRNKKNSNCRWCVSMSARRKFLRRCKLDFDDPLVALFLRKSVILGSH